jgi:hypothetical protein
MGFAVWAIVLAGIVFLFSINERLHGRLKQVIGGVLAIAIFGMCGVAVYLWGWLTGMGALIGAFALGALLDNPSLWVAKKLTRYPDRGVEEYGRVKLKRTTRDIASGKRLEQAQKERQEESRHMAAVVRRSRSQSAIQEVLARHGAAERDLEAFYQRFEITTLPPSLREVALGNAAMLDWFLSNSVAGEFEGKYVRNLRCRDASLLLSLWAAHTPEEAIPPG